MNMNVFGQKMAPIDISSHIGLNNRENPKKSLRIAENPVNIQCKIIQDTSAQR
jgi:hypothetical protein